MSRYLELADGSGFRFINANGDTTGKLMLVNGVLSGPTGLAPASLVGSGTLNLMMGVFHDVTLTGNAVAVLPSGLPLGVEYRCRLYVRQSAGNAFTFGLPTGVKYDGGSAPSTSIPAGSVMKIDFSSPDGGATWFGG